MPIEIYYPPGLTRKDISPYEIKILGHHENGNEPHIKAMVEHNGKLSIVNFFIDTGASDTFISKKDAKKLGFQPEEGKPTKYYSYGWKNLTDCYEVQCNLCFKGEIQTGDGSTYVAVECDANVIVANNLPISFLGWRDISRFTSANFIVGKRPEFIV